jgi:magnesium chelatase family protein
MDAGLLRRVVRPTPAVARVLQQSVDRHGLSARAYHRILKVARTIADLAGSEDVDEEHALEALSFRGVERRR